MLKGGATGSDVTRSHVTRSSPDHDWRQRKSRDQNQKSQKWSRAHAQPAPALFSYYSSSTKYTIARDRHGYWMWRNTEDVPLEGCVHAQPEVAQYPP